MEITSGGTAGPRLAETLWNLRNNVYGTLTDAPTPVVLAHMFVHAGWRARRTSDAEYQVEHRWAGIEFFRSGDDTCFSGVVDPDHTDLLATAFDELGLSYSVELWDSEHNTILRELSSRSQPSP